MGQVGEKSLPFTDALTRSYKLSYLILAGDGGKAVCVVTESLDEWKVDWAAQKHRTYHKPFSRKPRNKIIFSQPVLLQHIVCEKTVPYEKSQQADFINGLGSLDEWTLLLRYVKHMLQESSDRSFYVVVGICRVLHRYDHATTKRIYSVLDQRDQEKLIDGDPNNKTDDEYRRCKMVLVDKLARRFEVFLNIKTGPRNEKRFVAHDKPSDWYDYIRKCLALLIPWETEHVLPPEFKPTEFSIAGLKFEGKYRDEWHPVEENRLHTIIDPECFSRLIQACAAPPPEQQLDVPVFKNMKQNQGGGPSANIDSPPDLTVEQTKAILDELERRSRRRKVAFAPILSVEVDGVLCERMNTAERGNVRLEITPEAKQIQVFTTDDEGKLLLASLLLRVIDITEAGWESAISLEGGQKLRIKLNPLLNSAGELCGLVADISYREGNPFRVMAQCYRRVGYWLAQRSWSSSSLNPNLGAPIGSLRIYTMLLLLLAIMLPLAHLTYRRLSLGKNGSVDTYGEQPVQPVQTAETKAGGNEPVTNGGNSPKQDDLGHGAPSSGSNTTYTPYHYLY